MDAQDSTRKVLNIRLAAAINNGEPDLAGELAEYVGIDAAAARRDATAAGRRNTFQRLEATIREHGYKPVYDCDEETGETASLEALDMESEETAATVEIDCDGEPGAIMAYDYEFSVALHSAIGVDLTAYQ